MARWKIAYNILTNLIQFQGVVAVLILKQDAVLFDNEEFIKLGEEVAVHHFVTYSKIFI